MLRAYAKINLGLLILGKRPDGYHAIETIFHRINLYDEIVFERCPEVRVSTTDPDAPSDERNICHKAALLLRDHLGVDDGVEIAIRKSIPVGAGLGGGSADAGLVLRELPAFWSRTVDEAVLRSIALQLGSDVPYFLHNGSALARGRGEILEYFPLDIPYTILLCYPNIHVSTAWAYNNVTLTVPAPRVDLKSVTIDGMKKPGRFVNGLRNDFEPVVFREWPEILRVKEVMMQGGAEFASLSGSGSAVYGFFSQADVAIDVATHLQSKDHRTFLTDPHFTAG